MDTQRLMSDMVDMLKNIFADRLIYVGLQGSRSRSEERPDSDLDVMTVLDEVRMDDLSAYREGLNTLNSPVKACGFICGKDDLLNWNRCEICQLTHETIDYYGCLAALVPAYSRDDVRQHIKLSAGNLYHALCHHAIYGSREKDEKTLCSCAKGVFYILQNPYFLKTGEYFASRSALSPRLSDDDRAMLRAADALLSGEAGRIGPIYDCFLNWCQKVIREV